MRVSEQVKGGGADDFLFDRDVNKLLNIMRRWWSGENENCFSFSLVPRLREGIADIHEAIGGQ